ncbi:MAG: ABC transporter permease [Oscillospiraceae bacterium]|nr:ABC transporter permease [Oscillospiraceae bacterium]MCD8128198.1 ABC transporter permease [Oscillospiraceae bacterium]
MKKKRNISFHDVVPFVAFLAIFLFFTIASYNSRTGTFRMLTLMNLTTILEQAMQTIVVACGTLFVVSQGSTDLSVGVNLALSGVVGVWVGYATGMPYLTIPVILLVGLLLGLFNGFVVARLKVSSFMLTIAMLIGIRGLVNFIQTKTDVQRLPEELGFLTNSGVKIALFLVILVVMAYLFEFTKLGRYSRAIGENENTARFVGVPVTKMKIIAFCLSGLMAGFGAIFSLANVGATSQQMGSFLEMRVVMAILLGGVLVTGGTSARFYKILLGSFSIQIIINGLALMNKSDSYISQSVQGILLLLILFLSAQAGHRRKRAASESEAVGETLPEPPSSGSKQY